MHEQGEGRSGRGSDSVLAYRIKTFWDKEGDGAILWVRNGLLLMVKQLVGE